jgi:hypothetical protein
MTQTLDLTYKKVLFDQNSTSRVSPVFSVWPGYVSLISLFGMKNAFTKQDGALYNTACIVVQKVTVAGAALPQVQDSCGKDLNAVIAGIPRGVVDRFEDVMQDCGNAWVINPCNNYAIITIPGFYQLKVADEAQLGEFYVEQITVKAEHAIMYPSGLILGN